MFNQVEDPESQKARYEIKAIFFQKSNLKPLNLYKKTIFFAFLAAFFFVTGISAAEKTLFSTGKTLCITTQETASAKELTIPPISNTTAKDMRTMLVFDASFMIPKPGGWNFSFGIVINGKPVTRYDNAGRERLMRRGSEMITANRGHHEWWRGSNNLFILFGPGSKGELDKRILSAREEGYRYTLDVTDLLNSTGSNKIVFRNGMRRSQFRGKAYKLTIENIRIVCMSAAEADALRPGSVALALTIPKISIPPVIDGCAAVGEWDACPEYRLHRIGAGGLAAAETTVRFAYDSSNLYFLFRAAEPELEKIRNNLRNVEEHDNRIWTDDCIDLTIAPFGKKCAYKIIVNLSGIVYDAAVGDSRWESEVKTGISTGKDSWTMELAVPFSSLGWTPTGGELWEIAPGRVRYANGKEYSTLKESQSGGFADNMSLFHFAGKSGSVKAKLESGSISGIFDFGPEAEYDAALSLNGKKNFTTAISGRAALKLPCSKGGKLILSAGTYYHAELVLPEPSKNESHVFRVHSPLYQELIDATRKAPTGVIAWSHGYRPEKDIAPFALQYGIEYSFADSLKLAVAANYHFICGNGQLWAPAVKSVLYPLYSVSRRCKQFGVLNKEARTDYLEEVKRILKKNKANAAYFMMSDEYSQDLIRKVVEQCAKQGTIAPYLKAMDKEVKKNYGGGEWGIPHSLFDKTPGRWIAFQNYASDRFVEFAREVKTLVRKEAPELSLVSDDPQARGSRNVDFAKWRGLFDVLTLQTAPSRNSEIASTAFDVQKACDLSAAQDVRPCVHSENYFMSFTLDEVISLYSQAVQAGATGWQRYPNDIIGTRSGFKHLVCERFGAPERDLLFRTIAANTPILRRPTPSCAFFSSQDTAWSSWQNDFSNGELPAYTILGFGAGLWFRFINETVLEKYPAELDGIKTVFVVDARYERPEAVAALFAFAKKGGNLVIFDPDAFERTNLDHPFPGREKLLGVSVTGKAKSPKVLNYGNIKLKTRTAPLILTPAPGTVVEAVFADKTPAIVSKRHGSGKVLYFAFSPFRKATVRTTPEIRFLRQFVSKLGGLQLDNDIRRFRFPDSFIKTIPAPNGKCLTNNHIIWRLFEPDVSLNMPIKGTYTWSRTPDIIEDVGKKNIPFESGKLTNRRKAPFSRSVFLKKGKLENWIVSFDTRKEMSLTFDFGKIVSLERAVIFHQHSLPALSVLFSKDGKTWREKNFLAIVSESDAVCRSEFMIPGSARFVRFIFAASSFAHPNLVLSEMEIWHP